MSIRRSLAERLGLKKTNSAPALPHSDSNSKHNNNNNNNNNNKNNNNNNNHSNSNDDSNGNTSRSSTVLKQSSALSVNSADGSSIGSGGESPVMGTGKRAVYKCKMPDCPHTYDFLRDLRTHMRNDHADTGGEALYKMVVGKGDKHVPTDLVRAPGLFDSVMTNESPVAIANRTFAMAYGDTVISDKENSVEANSSSNKQKEQVEKQQQEQSKLSSTTTSTSPGSVANASASVEKKKKNLKLESNGPLNSNGASNNVESIESNGTASSPSLLDSMNLSMGDLWDKGSQSDSKNNLLGFSMESLDRIGRDSSSTGSGNSSTSGSPVQTSQSGGKHSKLLIKSLNHSASSSAVLGSPSSSPIMRSHHASFYSGSSSKKSDNDKKSPNSRPRRYSDDSELVAVYFEGRTVFTTALSSSPGSGAINGGSILIAAMEENEFAFSNQNGKVQQRHERFGSELSEGKSSVNESVDSDSYLDQSTTEKKKKMKRGNEEATGDYDKNAITTTTTTTTNNNNNSNINEDNDAAEDDNVDNASQENDDNDNDNYLDDEDEDDDVDFDESMLQNGAGKRASFTGIKKIDSSHAKRIFPTVDKIGSNNNANQNSSTTDSFVGEKESADKIADDDDNDDDDEGDSGSVLSTVEDTNEDSEDNKPSFLKQPLQVSNVPLTLSMGESAGKYVSRFEKERKDERGLITNGGSSASLKNSSNDRKTVRFDVSLYYGETFCKADYKRSSSFKEPSPKQLKKYEAEVRQVCLELGVLVE